MRLGASMSIRSLAAWTAGLVIAVASSTPSAGAQGDPAIVNVGFVVFPGVQIIDYAAPFEVFGQAAFRTKKYNVFTVAQTLDSLRTSGGPGAARILPRYSFANHPRIDVLVVPGGGGALPGSGGVGDQITNPAMVDWIRTNGNSAQIVLSVCNGALLIGKAGLLDGLRATTFWGMLDRIHGVAPTAQLVTTERFVDNGRVITTAGLSSGIDGALHVVERLSGHGLAQDVALGMEYDWEPDNSFVRSALPDMVLWDAGINSLLMRQLPGHPDTLAGTRTAFDEVIALDRSRTPSNVFREIIGVAAADTLWRRSGIDTAGRVLTGAWRVMDRRGEPINVKVDVETSARAADSTIVRIILRMAQRT